MTYEEYSAIKKSPPPLRKPNINPLHLPTKAMQPRHTPSPTASRLTTQFSNLRKLQRNTGTYFLKPVLRQLVAQHVFQVPQMNHVFDNMTGQRETLTTLLHSDKAKTWTTSLSNKWDRLSKGIKNRVVGTNTIDYIYKSEVPVDRKVTYGNFVCNHRPLNTEQWCVCLTVGDYRLECLYEAASPSTSLTETKLIINSTISDAYKGAWFMAC